MKLFLLLFAGIAASLISLRYFPLPYIWISLILFTVSAYVAVTQKRPLVKLLSFNLGVFILIFGSLEAYLWTSQALSDKERFEGDYNDYTKGYVVSDEVLGYAPGKGKAFTSIKFLGEKEIYNVTYTIDKNGLRVAPPYNNKGNSECVLFFGGSFTYGEGLNDNETLPYVVGIKTRGKYKIYNFSFHGYGPHQMLAAIEHDLVDTIVECKPRYAIYQAIVSHVDRSSGLSFWDRHGPRYILQSDGSVKYKGHFDDDEIHDGIRNDIKKQMGKSLFYEKYIDKEPVSRADIDLFVGIIDKSRHLLEERYPGLEFHMILWGGHETNREPIIRLLNERDIPLHLIEKILPDYSDHKLMYAIVPNYDNHPNALANELIADYIINHILKK